MNTNPMPLKQWGSILVLFLLIVSPIILVNHSSHSDKEFKNTNVDLAPMTSNTAYLNSTVNYFTSQGSTPTKNLSISPKLNTSPETWYFNQKPIGTNKSVDSHLTFKVGDYQYWASSPVGDQSYNIGFLIMEPNFALGFYAGVNNNGKANVGTVYASLIFSNYTTGKEMADYTWSNAINTTYSGNTQEIFIYPYWDPTIPTGYYNISLYVGVTPKTNYISGDPYDLFTAQSGTSPNGLSQNFPMYGWTYSGITDGFPISLPINTTAFEFSYNSSEPIQVNIGGTTSKQSSQNNIPFYSNSYKSGQFQNVLGDPNVSNIKVTFQETNIVVANSSVAFTLTSFSSPSQNQNWINSTYDFTLSTPIGALNGRMLVGKRWNTTWFTNVSHIKDYNTNLTSPVNNFYINGNFISSPKTYNNFSSKFIDSTNLTEAPFICLASNLINYYPSLVSSYESNQTVYSTQSITFIVNSSEKISGEPDRVSIQWGDGSYFTSNISTSYIFVVNHTYIVPGNYTPKVTITNFPNSQGMSLSTGELSLGTIDVRQIPISISTSRTVVNPLMPVNFIINTTTDVFPISDTINVNFGDNHTLSHSFVQTLSINASYSKTGIFSPFVQVISSGRVLTEVYASRITVAPIILQTKNVEVDNVEHLRLNYSSLSKVKNISLQINGNLTENFKIGNSNGTLYYNYTYIKRMINGTMYGNFELWVATTNYGYSQNTSNYYTPPVITNLSAGSNPTWVGDETYFNFEVYYVFNVYSTNTNSIKIYVDNQRINWEKPYYFNQSGNFAVKLVANNSYGNASYSYIQTVLPNNPIILSANASAEKVTPGTLVSFYANINWQGQVGNVTWSVNSDKLDGNSYNFTYPGNYSVSVLATNNQGSWGYSFNEVVLQMPSKINSISILPSVIHTGDIVTFSASVSWYKTNGSLIWQINGTNVTGDSYIFSVHGNYTLTVIAKNSYGSTSKSIEITVEPTPANGNLETVLLVVCTISGFLASGGFLYWRKHR